MRRIPAAVDLGEPGTPRVVIGFLALAIIATVIEFATFGASPTTSELSQSGGVGIGAIATGAWWKLLVSNLLHGNLPHVFMNAFVIFLTGRWLEHLAGPMLVLATIGWSAVASGVGSLVIDTPSVSIGASGVAFGLVGCAIAVDPRARTATGLIARQLGIVNLVLTFIIPGISIGGHLGGLAAGLAVGFLGWSRTTSEAHPAGRARRPVTIGLAAASLVPIAVLGIGPSALPGEAIGFRGDVTSWLLQRQLSGTTLSSGTKIDHASCEAGSDELTFDCDTDGNQVTVQFSTRDDQWGLRAAG
jgi:membrane associated rhomboid family serine protease